MEYAMYLWAAICLMFIITPELKRHVGDLPYGRVLFIAGVCCLFWPLIPVLYAMQPQRRG